MIKSILFVLFVTTTSVLSAGDVPVIISATNKWIVVEKSDWKAPQISIVLREAGGTVILRETATKTTKYNLKYVPDGNYVLDIEDGQRIRSQQLEIKKNIITGATPSTVYKPYYIRKGDAVDINLMAQGAPVKLVIRHSSGNVLHEEKFENQVAITKRYNLSDLAPGTYFIDVTHSGHSFTEMVEK